MYQYAILNENNICHTVYETDEERDDFDQKAIKLETYDTKYLNARWDDDLNDWEFPHVEFPQKDPDLDYMEKIDLIEKITTHFQAEFPDKVDEELNKIFMQFNIETPFNTENLSKEILEEIISHLDIN